MIRTSLSDCSTVRTLHFVYWMQLVLLWSHDQRSGGNRWLYVGRTHVTMVCGVRCDCPPWSFSFVHRLLVHDLWPPPPSGCCGKLCSGLHRQLVMSVSAVHLLYQQRSHIHTEQSISSSDCSGLLSHWACFWDLSSYFGKIQCYYRRTRWAELQNKTPVVKAVLFCCRTDLSCVTNFLKNYDWNNVIFHWALWLFNKAL